MQKSPCRKKSSTKKRLIDGSLKIGEALQGRDKPSNAPSCDAYPSGLIQSRLIQ